MSSTKRVCIRHDLGHPISNINSKLHVSGGSGTDL